MSNLLTNEKIANLIFNNHMEDQKVVTHSGQAHLDEVLTCGLIAFVLSQMGRAIRIFREDPGIDIDNEQVFVIDVGMQYDSDCLNWDHHQLERDAEAACTFSMVLQDFNNDFYIWLDKESDSGLVPWIRALKYIDSKGPSMTQKDLLNGGRIVTDPFSDIIVEWFVDDPLRATMLTKDIIGSWYKRYCDEVKIKEEVEELHIAKFELSNESVAVIVPTMNEKVIECLEKEWSLHSPAVIIFFDDRAHGWVLYRRNDAPGIDFSLLKDDNRILWTHNGGFIAKTLERYDIATCVELVGLAIV